MRPFHSKVSKGGSRGLQYSGLIWRGMVLRSPKALLYQSNVKTMKYCILIKEKSEDIVKVFAVLGTV